MIEERNADLKIEAFLCLYMNKWVKNNFSLD
jgi:hypothetical protein